MRSNRHSTPLNPADLYRSRTHAERRLRALRRACAAGGVSLALLAGGATLNPAQAQSDEGVRERPRLNTPNNGLALRRALVTSGVPADNQRAPAFTLNASTTPFGLTAVGTYNGNAGFADMDGDGDVDVLLGGFYGNFTYFENTAGPGATPAFAAGVSNPYGLTDVGFYSSPSVMDLDGDGDLDVLSGDFYGDFHFFENTAGPGATPAFAAEALNPFGLTNNGSNVPDPSVIDVDGDGDLDIMAGAFQGFTFFENTAGPGATPAFAPYTTNPFGLATVPYSTGYIIDYVYFSSPSMADVDGDGDLDLLAGNYFGGHFYFENSAGPNTAPMFASYAYNPYGLSNVVGCGGMYATNCKSSPEVSDLDGDGDLDVLTGEYGNALYFFENAGLTPAPTQTTQLDGTEGWRMLASPSEAATLDDLVNDPLWIQGVSDGDASNGAPNLYTYDETVGGTLDNGYEVPAALSGVAGSGVGYLVYVYSDDDNDGTPEGFPKTLDVDGAAPAAPFDFPVSYTVTTPAVGGGLPDDDGWNMLGNPFSSWFDWDAAVLNNIDATVYVWDPALGSFRTYNGGAGNLEGGIIAPWQGFWAKANGGSPSLSATPSVSSGGPLYGREAAEHALIGLRLTPEAGGSFREGLASEAFVTLGQPNAQVGLDRLDGYALTPAAAEHVMLATAGDGEHALAIDARPQANQERIEIPLLVDATASGTFLRDWPELSALPADWVLTLKDQETGAEIDLREATEYAFTLEVEGGRVAANPLALPLAEPIRLGSDTARLTNRFTLVIDGARSTANEADPLPGGFALETPRPNPTTGSADIAFALERTAEVQIAVYDALGRRVAVLADGNHPAGQHVASLQNGTLAAGVYVVRAMVQGEDGPAVLTRRLTVLR